MTSPAPHTEIEITLSELARRSHRRPSEIRKFVYLGMPHRRDGRTWRFQEELVKRWLAVRGIANGEAERAKSEAAVGGLVLMGKEDYQKNLQF